MELNADQNEMTHNLNSALSDDFMERSTIKIMDGIIADGKNTRPKRMKMKQTR